MIIKLFNGDNMARIDIDVQKSGEIKKYFDKFKELIEDDVTELDRLLSEALLGSGIQVRSGLKMCNFSMPEIAVGIENLLLRQSQYIGRFNHELVDLTNRLLELHSQMCKSGQFITHNIPDDTGLVYRDFNSSIICILPSVDIGVDDYFKEILAIESTRNEMISLANEHPSLINNFMSQVETALQDVDTSIRTLSTLSSSKLLEDRVKQITHNLVNNNIPNPRLSSNLIAIFQNTYCNELLDIVGPEVIKNLEKSNTSWLKTLATDLSHTIINNKTQIAISNLSEEDKEDLVDWNDRVSNSSLSL